VHVLDEIVFASLLQSSYCMPFQIALVWSQYPPYSFPALSPPVTKSWDYTDYYCHTIWTRLQGEASLYTENNNNVILSRAFLFEVDVWSIGNIQ
jgi:hypothetical protein